MASLRDLGRSAALLRGLFYGWRMALLGGLIMGMGTVPLFQGLPVWNPVLRNSFGWSAGQMSWAFAATRIEGGLLGPLEGLLVERLGSRTMVLIGMLILGGGFVLFSQIQELWQLYATFVMMSFGGALGTWLPMMTVLNHWFIRSKTRAMSIMMEGHALGGMAVPLIMAWAIGGIDPSESERLGWRLVAFIIGVTIMASAFPLSRLIRNRPEDMGMLPDGGPPQVVPVIGQAQTFEEETAGYTWQEAIKTRTFWLISFGHAGSSVIIVAVMVHLGLMLDDRGYSLQTIGGVVAAFTGVNAVFLLVGGYVGDRLGMRLTAFWFAALQPVSVVILVLADSVPMVFLFAVLLGIGRGGCSPATSAMRGVYFGRRAFAAITGISMLPMNLFLFFAPLFAGYLRDITGNYDIAFLTVAGLAMVGSFLFLGLGEPKSAPSARG